MVGNNSSKLKGEGYDFLELKEYEYGDDVKNIDWIITAKMQKPFVKVYHAQKELNITLIPIMSGSLHFGTKRFKNDLLIEICAILGFSAIKQGDAFESYIYNTSLDKITKKSKNIHSVSKLCDELYNYNLVGSDCDYENINNEIFKKIKKKSVIFIIGDFLDINRLDLKLLSKKHEVIAIIVRDKFEEDPNALGNISLQDPSNNLFFTGNFNNSTIAQYKSKIKENDHKLYNHFQNCGIDFIKIYTHEEPLSKLLGLLYR